MAAHVRRPRRRRRPDPPRGQRVHVRRPQPVYDVVIDRSGLLEADIARGISLRHDWGRQCRSGHLTGLIRRLEIDGSPAYVGEPDTNGFAERRIRILKQQCLWVRPCTTIDELRQAVAAFTDHRIHRMAHRTARPVASRSWCNSGFGLGS